MKNNQSAAWRTSQFLLTALLAGIMLTVLSRQLTLPASGQTPSGEPTIDPDIQEKVEERLQKVLTAQTEPKRAFYGKITDINSVLELQTSQGSNQVKIDTETTIIDQAKKEIEKADLEIDSYVIAMGYLDESGVLNAKRVLVTQPKPRLPDLQVIFGEVTDKSSDEKIFTVKNFNQGAVYQVEVTTKSKLSQKVEGEIETITFDDLKIGDKLVTIGTASEQDSHSLSAKTIYVLPTLLNNSPKTNENSLSEESTPSSTPTKKATDSGE